MCVSVWLSACVCVSLRVSVSLPRICVPAPAGWYSGGLVAFSMRTQPMSILQSPSWGGGQGPRQSLRQPGRKHRLGPKLQSPKPRRRRGPISQSPKQRAKQRTKQRAKPRLLLRSQSMEKARARGEAGDPEGGDRHPEDGLWRLELITPQLTDKSANCQYLGMTPCFSPRNGWHNSMRVVYFNGKNNPNSGIALYFIWNLKAHMSPASGGCCVKVMHILEWLRKISPRHFTQIYLNTIYTEREVLYSWLYLLTGLQPNDRLPSFLVFSSSVTASKGNMFLARGCACHSDFCWTTLNGVELLWACLSCFELVWVVLSLFELFCFFEETSGIEEIDELIETQSTAKTGLSGKHRPVDIWIDWKVGPSS